MRILLYPICAIKGHNVDPNESIVGETMIDRRNWLCKCHRCGLYEMHDGAISGISLTVTHKTAMRIKWDFETEFARLKDMVERCGEAE